MTEINRLALDTGPWFEVGCFKVKHKLRQKSYKTDYKFKIKITNCVFFCMGMNRPRSTVQFYVVNNEINWKSQVHTYMWWTVTLCTFLYLFTLESGDSPPHGLQSRTLWSCSVPAAERSTSGRQGQGTGVCAVCICCYHAIFHEKSYVALQSVVKFSWNVINIACIVGRSARLAGGLASSLTV